MCLYIQFWIVSRCQVQGGVVRPIDFIYVEILVANVVGPGDGGKIRVFCFGCKVVRSSWKYAIVVVTFSYVVCYVFREA